MGRSLFHAMTIATLMLSLVWHIRADPLGCCQPIQWEAVFDQKTAFYDGSYASDSNARITTHIDYTRQMVVNEAVTVNGSVTTVETQIFEFNKHVAYIITGFNCQITNLTDDMPPFCIEENSAYLGERDILGVKADVWFLSSIGGASNVTTVRTTVSRDYCMLIQKVYLSISGVSLFYITTAENVTLGIRDPSIFNIPSICDQASSHPKSPYKTFPHAPVPFKHF